MGMSLWQNVPQPTSLALLGIAYVSVKAYGAKVDGSSDDTAAFAAAAATGLDVYIGAGTMVITSGVTLSAAQQVFGDGKEISFIQVNGNGYDAVTLAASYAGVRDLSFTATAARTSNAYVKLSAATRGNFVQRVKMTNAFYGIQGNNVATVITTLEDIEIVNTAPTNGIGIYIWGGNDTFMNRIVMDAPNGSQPLCGIRIRSTQAVWMTDIDLIHQGRGVQIDPQNATGDFITWCFFTNVACDSCSGDGLYINPNGGSTIKGLFFNGCWFSTCLNGVNILKDAGSVIDGIWFDADCKFLNNQNRGAWVQNGINIEINNCKASGNSQSASGTYGGIEFANSVTNFAVRNTRSGPVAGFANTQSYGLVLGTSCDSYILTDNNFVGNATGAALDNSQTTSVTREVRGNLGWKTIASGVATISNGANQVSVTHGLAGTPTIALANPSNVNIGAASPWWTGTYGATTFNINTAANVGQNSPFAWTASLYN